MQDLDQMGKGRGQASHGVKKKKKHGGATQIMTSGAWHCEAGGSRAERQTREEKGFSGTSEEVDVESQGTAKSGGPQRMVSEEL